MVCICLAHITNQRFNNDMFCKIDRKGRVLQLYHAHQQSYLRWGKFADSDSYGTTDISTQ